MSRTRIFAYGSNMRPERMRERVPDARSGGRARLADHRLVIDKLGRDGSAKANLRREPGARVWGVVWELVRADVVVLDGYEGGYERVAVQVTGDEGACLEAETYLSTRLTSDGRTHAWYREHMVEGARAHGLPADYVAWLASLPVLPGGER